MSGGLTLTATTIYFAECFDRNIISAQFCEVFPQNCSDANPLLVQKDYVLDKIARLLVLQAQFRGCS